MFWSEVFAIIRVGLTEPSSQEINFLMNRVHYCRILWLLVSIMFKVAREVMLDSTRVEAVFVSALRSRMPFR